MFYGTGLEADVVPGIGFFNSGMMRDRQSGGGCSVERRFHHVAMHTKKLHAIGPLFLELRDAGAGFRRIGRAAQHRVDEQARSNAVGIVTHGDCEFRIAPDIAHGCDAASQPKFQDVVGIHRRAATFGVQVAMKVDKAGQHVASFCVDHRISGSGLHSTNACDETVFDEDIGGA